MHYVFNISKRDSLVSHRGVVLPKLRLNASTIEPIELTDGSFCVPEACATDENLRELKTQLEKSGVDIRGETIRRINPSEVKGNQDIRL